MKIKKQEFPSDRGVITWYTITNSKGASVTLSTLGAGIVAVNVPDRNGKIDNVCLAYESASDYIADGPCLGKCPGRYANRIANGHLEVDGKEYELTINNGPNALHGGPEGFQNQIWDAVETEDGVTFTYYAKDDEEHYPGNMKVEAEYHWNDENVLSLMFNAVSDAPTVVNLTNHAYWNLKGADAGSVLEHELKIDAEGWLPTDATQIPIGEIDAVAGTPMDFREFKKIGRDINSDFEALKIGKGYDHCWVVTGWEPGVMREVVFLKDDESGRELVVSSDQPGVQIYTGNWLAGSPLNRNGRSYNDYDGVAIEMQGFPDAPNKPQFPSQILNPGESYSRKIEFKFR